MAISPSWSLTEHLLSLDRPAYEAATRSPFLLGAGQGRLDKTTLGTWLANDRLYIHAYLRAAGRSLAAIDLPLQTTTTAAAPAPETRLVDWLVESLVGLRREEHFFVDAAARYGIALDLADAGKLPGLSMFEALFASLHPTAAAAAADGAALPLPWLEAAVVFWGTERVYSDAWTWARSHLTAGEGAEDGSRDADGGALRREFVPNWANEDFVRFVQQVSDILDGAVSQTLDVLGNGVKAGLVERAEKVWRQLVAAEAAFWPEVE